MRRHVKSNDIVFLIVLFKLVRVMALMTIKDQQAITTNSSSLSMLLEMPNLIYASLVCSLAIFRDNDYLVRWKSTILVLRHKVIFVGL
jgi:hypothetical protein